MSADDQLIIALDFSSRREAIDLVRLLDHEVGTYKVGLELLTAAGPSVVKELRDLGKSVFLDLKLHEIPHSVASAVRACGRLGASMVTVHASAGSAVLSAAVEATTNFPELSVLALTVITSLTDESLADVGVLDGVEAQVARLTTLAEAAGCHGVVASPKEVALCRALLPPQALVVVPGATLGPGDGPAMDHARAADATHAVAAGASHLIMGRSITRAADSRRVAQHAIRAIAIGAATR